MSMKRSLPVVIAALAMIALFVACAPIDTSTPSAPATPNLLATKVVILTEDAATTQGVILTTPPVYPTPKPGTNFEAPPWGTEIFEPGNSWSITANGQDLLVYAGADGKNHQQGVVIVYWKSDGHDNWVPTPSAHGVVKITDAQGTTLTLSALDGTTFTFDAATQKFDDPYPAP